MTTIAARLDAVRARIAAAARHAGREPADVTLLAVSKTWPAEAVREAAAAGQRAFGENYVQEGVDKVEALRALDLEWHFIGPLQSNKTRPVANAFDWVHGIDRLRIAERLSAQRDVHLPPLNVCIQVNVSGEDSKSGVAPAEAGAPRGDGAGRAADPTERIVGVARYVVDEVATGCEFAVTVADDWQRSGLAGRLMRALVDRARAAGLAHMEGIVLSTNRPMLQLAHALGFTLQHDADDPRTVRARLALGPR